ncbi:MAG: hypothetical protein JXA95_15925 [Spirochaetales bacterium]|nr:hypothetical protein [Spirochaetales bacterium]
MGRRLSVPAQEFHRFYEMLLEGDREALMAYAEIPDIRNGENCRRIVRYFLKRQVYFKSDDPQKKIRGGMGEVKEWATLYAYLAIKQRDNPDL